MRFLEDQCLDGGTPREKFPQIHSIAQQKRARIFDCYTGGFGGGREWQILVSRNQNDWEIGEYEKLLSLLSLLPLNGDNDSPWWTLTKNEAFTVKSFYKRLFKCDNRDVRIPFRQIWKVKIPPRVSFLHGRLVEVYFNYR